MQKILGIFLVLSGAHSALFGSVSFVSQPQYTPQGRVTNIAVSYTSSSSRDPMGQVQYTTTATYGSLASGTVLRFWTGDTFHTYGPYGPYSSQWSMPTSSGSYASLTLLNNSSGGSFNLLSFTPVTAVDYEGMVYDSVLSGYQNVISYGPLAAGSSLLLYTSDTFHVYGPYSSSDGWGMPEDLGSYSRMTLGNSTSGGSVMVSTTTALSSVSAIPEASVFSLLAVGLGGLAILGRRRA